MNAPAATSTPVVMPPAMRDELREAAMLSENAAAIVANVREGFAAVELVRLEIDRRREAYRQTVHDALEGGRAAADTFEKLFAAFLPESAKAMHAQIEYLEKLEAQLAPIAVTDNLAPVIAWPAAVEN
jgi:hypothetical protein